MKKWTHNITAMCLGEIIFVALCRPQPLLFSISMGYFLTIGSLNDLLDFTVFSFLEHRNMWTHSFFSPVAFVVSLLAYFGWQFVLPSVAVLLAWITLLLYWFHVGLDTLNPTGVYLSPHHQIHGRIKSDHFLFNLFLDVLSLCVFLKYLNIAYA